MSYKTFYNGINEFGMRNGARCENIFMREPYPNRLRDHCRDLICCEGRRNPDCERQFCRGGKGCDRFCDKYYFGGGCQRWGNPFGADPMWDNKPDYYNFDRAGMDNQKDFGFEEYPYYGKDTGFINERFF